MSLGITIIIFIIKRVTSERASGDNVKTTKCKKKLVVIQKNGNFALGAAVRVYSDSKIMVTLTIKNQP